MSKPNTLSLSLLEARVLWVISKKPTHGYAMLKELNKGRKRKTTNGTLYPILQKLLRAKLIGLKKTGLREKKVYEISKNGSKTLNEALAAFFGMFGEIFSNFFCKSCGCRLNLKVKG